MKPKGFYTVSEVTKLLYLVGILNFVFLQFFFVRLALVFSEDIQIKGVGFIGPIVPFTGWFGLPYIGRSSLFYYRKAK